MGLKEGKKSTTSVVFAVPAVIFVAKGFKMLYGPVVVGGRATYP
jgi:hypothetical protein